MGNGASAAKAFGPEAAAIVRKPRTSLTPDEKGATEHLLCAAGCFWGLQLAFQRVPGVVKTTVGYAMGNLPDPTYEEVCSGITGHTEAVLVVFYQHAVSYGELLTVLWDRMDPTAEGYQGNDFGPQYRSGIYFYTNEQRDVALESRRDIQKAYRARIATEILPAKNFWPAEERHQQYLAKLGQTAKKGRCDAIRCYG